jgi:hypothetical protein
VPQNLCNYQSTSPTAAWRNRTTSINSSSRCDVAIEQPNHAHQKGNPFRVRIDVTVPPGHELVSDEQGVDNGSYAPLTKVIHDAFKTMERELRRLVEKQHGEVKTHAGERSPK